MAANIDPIFPLTPNVGVAALSAACTSLTSITNQATVITAGASGTIVTRVTGKAAGVTAAGIISLWLYDGSTYTLYEQLASAAVTPSGTVLAATVTSGLITPTTPLKLKTGWTLVATTYNAETWKVTGEGGDY